jgi:hypothetical protein
MHALSKPFLTSEESKNVYNAIYVLLKDMDVPSKELAQMAIGYAREMEQIV